MMIKTDENLQKDVQEAIKWEPLLNETNIGVTAKDGVVMLSGNVDNYAKKLGAENAAKNVRGVKAVVEEIKINLNSDFDDNNDVEIANQVLHALKWNWVVPNDMVKVKVENGWVTLDGELLWYYQREVAIKAVNHIFGIRGITNNIKIQPDKHDTIEKVFIERALSRNWSIDNRKIKVSIDGNKVILTGTVHSIFEKDETERMAWNAPGVLAIENQLEIINWE